MDPGLKLMLLIKGHAGTGLFPQGTANFEGGLKAFGIGIRLLPDLMNAFNIASELSVRVRDWKRGLPVREDFYAAENEVIIHRLKSERATFPPNDKRSEADLLRRRPRPAWWFQRAPSYLLME
jgi:hypothetical protein